MGEQQTTEEWSRKVDLWRRSRGRDHTYNPNGDLRPFVTFHAKGRRVMTAYDQCGTMDRVRSGKERPPGSYLVRKGEECGRGVLGARDQGLDNGRLNCRRRRCWAVPLERREGTSLGKNPRSRPRLTRTSQERRRGVGQKKDPHMPNEKGRFKSCK